MTESVSYLPYAAAHLPELIEQLEVPDLVRLSACSHDTYETLRDDFVWKTKIARHLRVPTARVSTIDAAPMRLAPWKTIAAGLIVLDGETRPLSNGSASANAALYGATHFLSTYFPARLQEIGARHAQHAAFERVVHRQAAAITKDVSLAVATLAATVYAIRECNVILNLQLGADAFVQSQQDLGRVQTLIWGSCMELMPPTTCREIYCIISSALALLVAWYFGVVAHTTCREVTRLGETHRRHQRNLHHIALEAEIASHLGA